jgi:protein SCO1
MRSVATMRGWKAGLSLGLLLLTLVCVCGPQAGAQVSDYGSKQAGPVRDEAPQLLKNVAIIQKLNTQIPLGLEFRDETGKDVHLGDYFGKRPVILSMVYYQCKMLCPEEIDGLVSALMMVKFRPGKDFDVVFVSIDPSETPEIAAQEKALYVKRYGHPETANGWHFLTGQQPAINSLASAVGFGYTRVPGPDGVMNQFAHASSIELLTADGKLSQYYLGVEYPPNDLRLGLVETSEGKIGSPVDAILTYCYRYNPLLNRHDLVIARLVQGGCLLTMLLLGSYMFINFRRDIRNGHVAARKAVHG